MNNPLKIRKIMFLIKFENFSSKKAFSKVL